MASQRRSGRTAGPGFHLCPGTMRTLVVLESPRVAAVRPGRRGCGPAPAPVPIPCSETCLDRMLSFGICFLDHVGSLFPSVIENGKFSACISLDFFSLPIICFCDSFLPKSALLCSVTRGLVSLSSVSRCYLVSSVL